MKRIFGSRSSNSIRVVLADDQPEVRGVLKRALERDGRFLVVGEAEDGSQALDKARDESPDVIIIDLAMPNMDGMEALGRIVDQAPETKVVVLSSMANFSGSREHAMELGASAVFDKYTSPKRLIKAIVGLVEG